MSRYINFSFPVFLGQLFIFSQVNLLLQKWEMYPLPRLTGLGQNQMESNPERLPQEYEVSHHPIIILLGVPTNIS